MKSIIAIGLAVLVATPAVAVDPAPLAVILRGPEQAVLTHPLTDTTVEQRLELAATDVFIDSSSRIDVSARGYLGSRSGGNPVDSGLTLGNTALNSSTRRNGGGYGGSGGIGSVGGTGNMLYGIPEDPTDPGSGGGSDGGAAGNGGGVVRLQAGTLQLDGMVLANGGNEGYLGGGGTGGAIRLTAKTLSGAGAVQAGGGNGDGNYGSGGGGGRIAIHYENGAAFTLANVLANGGIGFGPGANGSLFLVQTNITSAQFVIASLKPRNAPVQAQSGGSPSTSAQWEMECFGPKVFLFESVTGDEVEGD